MYNKNDKKYQLLLHHPYKLKYAVIIYLFELIFFLTYLIILRKKNSLCFYIIIKQIGCLKYAHQLISFLIKFKSSSHYFNTLQKLMNLIYQLFKNILRN